MFEMLNVLCDSCSYVSPASRALKGTVCSIYVDLKAENGMLHKRVRSSMRFFVSHRLEFQRRPPKFLLVSRHAGGVSCGLQARH